MSVDALGREQRLSLQRPSLIEHVLKGSLVAVLVLAPLEGYLQDVDANLSKLAPGVFLVTWVAARLISTRPLQVMHPVAGCCAALLAVVLVSASAHTDDAWTMGNVIRWAPFLVLTVAMVDVLSSEVAPWLAVRALVLGATFSALGATISFVFFGQPRATGPLEDPNDLAYVLTAAVPIALVAIRAGGRPWPTAVWASVTAVLLLGASLTFSRGGLLALFAVTIWALSRRLLPARVVVGAAVMLGILLTTVVFLAQDLVAQAFAQKSYIAAANVDTRLLRWQAAARMLGEHPLLGVGPGGFPTHYSGYSNFAELAEPTPVAHEMYLEVGAEIGVLGLICFLGVIVAAFIATEQTVRRAGVLNRRAGALSAALAVQGSLVAICVSSIFLSEQYYMPLWAAVATAAACEQRSRGHRD